MLLVRKLDCRGFPNAFENGGKLVFVGDRLGHQVRYPYPGDLSCRAQLSQLPGGGVRSRANAVYPGFERCSVNPGQVLAGSKGIERAERLGDGLVVAELLAEPRAAFLDLLWQAVGSCLGRCLAGLARPAGDCGDPRQVICQVARLQ